MRIVRNIPAFAHVQGISIIIPSKYGNTCIRKQKGY